MTTQELRAVALDVLAGIAPESDLERIDPTQSLQEQFDLDSFDLLNFMVGLDERLGVDIPERDYPRLTTLNDCVGYLQQRIAERESPGVPAEGSRS